MEEIVKSRHPSIEFSANAHTDIQSFAGYNTGRMFEVPRQQQAKQLTVILELDRMQLGKAVYMLNNEETQRVGVRLAGGYA
jgi:hypothetical protein